MDYLQDLEAKAMHAYDLILAKAIEEIASILKGEALAKSDWDQLHAPRLEVDISIGIKKALDKYLEGLRYILLGPAAGGDAEKAIEMMRLLTKVPKGVAVQSFLSSVDAHTEAALPFGEVPVADKWMERSLDVLNERCGRQVDQHIDDLRNRLLNRLEASVQEQMVKPKRHAIEQIEALKQQAMASQERKKLIKDLITDATEHKVSLAKVQQDLKDATKDYSTNWKRIVSTEVGLASNNAAAQTIQAIAGLEDPIVVTYDIRDNRESDFCRENSRDSNGNWKYFRLSTLKPAGYNLGRKRNDWKNSIPKRHFNCFVGSTRINTSSGYLTAEEMATDLLGTYGNVLYVRQDETITYQVDGRVSKKGTLDHHYRRQDRQIESARPVCVGQQQTIRFTLKDGHVLEVSTDHNMKVFTKNAGETIPASEVKVGDMLPIQGTMGMFGQLHFPDIAELMGSCLGDGVFGKNNVAVFYYFGKDQPYGATLKTKAMSITNGKCSADGTSDKGGKYNLPHTRWSSAALWRIFGDLGMAPKYTGYKVPSAIWGADRATVGAFLRGLYSADGSVTTGFNKAFNRNKITIALTSKSLELLREIQILMGQLGIIGHIYTQDKECTKVIKYADGREFETKRKATWRLMIGGTTNASLFLKYVGFGQDFKNQKIQHILDTTPESKSGATRCSAVETIEYRGLQNVYAVSIPEFQSVIANGVTTGNCRCELVYVPNGYKLDNNGSLEPLEEGETLPITIP